MTPLRMLVLAVVISGIGPVLVRESPVGPAATAFWRVAIALPAAWWLARYTWRLAPRESLGALLSGLLLAADLVMWNGAILRTSILEATVLVMVFPILVAAGEIGFFGRRLSWRLLAGGAIAFAGTALIAFSAPRGASSLTGDLMALAAAAVYSVSLLISGQLCRRNPASAVTVWVLLGATLGALPVALWEASIVPDSLFGWAYLGFYGALTFAAYALFNTALSKLPTTLVAVSSYGQPVIATGLAVVLLGEIPTLASLLGSAVIIAGLLLAMLRG